MPDDIRVAVVPEIIDANGHPVGDVLNATRGEFITCESLPKIEIALRAFQAGIRYGRLNPMRVLPPLPAKFIGDVD